MTSESLQRKHQPQTIRVLTFNILSPDQANWERRRQAVRTGLRALQPDVLALQETTPGHAQDQLTDLLGPEYHVVENPGSLRGHGRRGSCQPVAVRSRSRG
jgi:mRNA deadenylase 3'-5' endonuclease subunit Ccr4